jgi:hypothetical protein
MDVSNLNLNLEWEQNKILFCINGWHLSVFGSNNIVIKSKQININYADWYSVDRFEHDPNRFSILKLKTFVPMRKYEKYAQL